MPKLKTKYLKIKEAALFLGVSPGTLRAWDKNDRLKPFRRDGSKYRLYHIADLHKFVESNRLRRYNKIKR